MSVSAMFDTSPTVLFLISTRTGRGYCSMSRVRNIAINIASIALNYFQLLRIQGLQKYVICEPRRMWVLIVT